MSGFYKFIFAILVLVGVTFTSNEAKAHRYPPYLYHGHVHGVPVGYGYFWLNGWHRSYGYSFFNYYGHAPVYATFGVISYSASTDKSGFGWGYHNIEDATAVANRACGANDCQPAVWVQGGCAALAVDKADGRLGWGYATKKGAAKREALKACRSGGDSKGCLLSTWVCSF